MVTSLQKKKDQLGHTRGWGIRPGPTLMVYPTNGPLNFYYFNAATHTIYVFIQKEPHTCAKSPPRACRAGSTALLEPYCCTDSAASCAFVFFSAFASAAAAFLAFYSFLALLYIVLTLSISVNCSLGLSAVFLGCFLASASFKAKR